MVRLPINLFVFVFLSVMTCSVPAFSQSNPRLALIIGNSAYKHATALANPVNDAELLDFVLRRHSVETMLHKDLSLQGFRQAVSDFATRLRNLGGEADGILFYAGHGVQFAGRNFLLPIDADIKAKSDVPLYSVELDNIIQILGSTGNRSNFIILDACRNDPYRGLFRGSQGLTAEGAPPGFLISFSTSPNTVAEDGKGNNSTFAASLAKFIQTPGMPIETVLKRVRYTVWKETNRAQIPWENSALFTDFYLIPPMPSQETQRQNTPVPTLREPRETLIPISFTIGQEGKTVEITPGKGKEESFRDCDDCPEMVVVPSGVFQMGASDNAQTSPAHEVRIPKPFAISKYEVSFAEFLECKICNKKLADEGWGLGRSPTVNVSWGDAKQYVDWLTKETGKKYRLLSEAEWEYAARSGGSELYWFGNNVLPSQANLDFGDAKSKLRTLPHDTLPTNNWGLAHVHGNVSEWTVDCWHPDYQNKPVSIQYSGDAWVEDGCYGRVIRGGSWSSPPAEATLPSRSWRRASWGGPDLGIRVMRELN